MYFFVGTCLSCGKSYPDGIDVCDEDGGEVLDEAVLDEEPDLAPGDEVGDYEVRAKIGKGACGTVYSAVHKLIGKEAAIKVLSRQHSANRNMVARFLSEARAVNQIRHRNIVDIFAFGRIDDGRQYCVMELLEGQTLQSYIDENGPMSVSMALPLLRRIARALDAAHRQGIAHRDLKPENIFLIRDEEGMFPKLLDFGIAKLLGDDTTHKTQTGAPIGTPLFMSPEQWRGKGVDHRADIYSLGVVTYEMLTGHLPFDGDSMGDVMLQVCTEDAPPASTLRPDLPDGLDHALLRMVAKHPDNRPDSAGEAITELTEAAASFGLVPDTQNADISSRFSAVGVGDTSVSEVDAKPDPQLAETAVPVSQVLAPPMRSNGRFALWASLAAVLTFGVGWLFLRDGDDVQSTPTEAVMPSAPTDSQVTPDVEPPAATASAAATPTASTTAAPSASSSVRVARDVRTPVPARPVSVPRPAPAPVTSATGGLDLPVTAR